MPVVKVFLLALLLGIAAGCTLQPRAGAEPAASAESAPAQVTGAVTIEAPPAPLAPGLLHDLLLGEIAAQRGNLPMALERYLAAARDSTDARIAERATRIAAFARDPMAALAAARRWAELEPDRPEPHQALAALYIRTGNTQAARTELETMLRQAQVAPENGLIAIAGMLAREPDRAAALATMKGLTESFPQEPAAHLAYAELALQARELDAAEAAAREALKLKPDWVEARLLLARLHAQRGDAGAALKELRAAVQSQPADTRVRLAYARLLINERQLDEARKQFEQLEQASPDDPDVLLTLGLLWLESDQWDEAKRYFSKLLDTGQRDAEAHYYLGRLAEERKQYDAALAAYSDVPNGELKPEAEGRAALVVGKQGDVERARALLTAVRERHPDWSARLYLVEGEILDHAKQYQEAYRVYDHALQEHADDLDLLYARALTAEKLDRLAVLEQDLRRVLAVEPDNVHALNALGYTLADRTDRYQEALGYIVRALELMPGDAAILDSMGWVQYRLGNLTEAVKYLRAAYRRNPDAEIAAHLSQALWKQGDQRAARQTLTEALARDPDSPDLKKLLPHLAP